MKKYLYFYCFIIFLFLTMKAHAQGCVAVRQMGGNTICSSSSYNLHRGEFQLGTSYRYFHSWRHFVGTEEQHERQTTGGGHDANGKERGNAVNIYSHAIDISFSYALTDRLQLSAFIPYVHNERSQVLRAPGDTVRYSVFAKGLGDIRLTANYWLFDPMEYMDGNLSLGVGVKLNNGSYRATDDALAFNNEGELIRARQVMDQAIQPGDGGIGISIEFLGFKKLYRGIYGFTNGYYLFNPRESNGSFKSGPTIVYDKDRNILGTLYGYNVYASPDQYFARAGFMASVGKTRNLTFSLAGRTEGIPAYDAFGGQVAYRRPGYVVAIESGINYRHGNHSFSFIVPYNFIKNRIQSAADIARQNLENTVITDASQKVHRQGDAAFADYSINISYNYRLSKLFGKPAVH